MATNDPAESQFAALTRQLQSFGRLLGIHAAAVGQSCFNGDLSCDLENPDNNGTFYQLSPDMHDSLLEFALRIAPEIRKAEKVALNRQREAKQRRIKLLREKKIVAAQREYTNALTYIDMFHSSACWKTVIETRQAYSKLTSVTAQKEAVKEQIRIRVVIFDWMIKPYFPR